MPVTLSPDEATAALRRIGHAWQLDHFDTTALVRAADADFSTIEWTEERLVRIGLLVELEEALPKLESPGGVPRWIATAKPGPFFGDQSPLQILKGPTRDMTALLREVRGWIGRR